MAIKNYSKRRNNETEISLIRLCLIHSVAKKESPFNEPPEVVPNQPSEIIPEEPSEIIHQDPFEVPYNEPSEIKENKSLEGFFYTELLRKR